MLLIKVTKKKTSWPYANQNSEACLVAKRILVQAFLGWLLRWVAVGCKYFSLGISVCHQVSLYFSFLP